jgi:hypothetical protein
MWSELQDLQDKMQVSLQGCGINDNDCNTGFFRAEKVPGNLFFRRRREK